MMRLSTLLPSAGIDMNVSSETRCAAGRGHAHVAPSRCALLGGFARDAFVADDAQYVAGRRNVGETHHLDRNRRTGFLDLLALVVDERAHFTKGAPSDDDIANAQRAVLHEHRRNRTAPAMQRRLDDDAARAPVLVGA